MMLWKRLPYLLPWRRRREEREMREELRSIAEMAEPGELGNLTLAAEDARAVWGWTRLEQAGQDVRYAIRGLGRNPGFAGTVMLSLAIGIGANTALFTIVNAVMWTLLPVADPETLLVLHQSGPGGTGNGFTYQQYTLLRAGDAAELAAYSRAPLNISIDGAMEPTTDGQLVSGNYFQLLGVRPQRGRLLEPSDDLAAMEHPVAVISDRYWRNRFGARDDVPGTRIAISGVQFTIVGVAPPEFFGVEIGTTPRVFVPLSMQPAVMPTTYNLLVEKPTLFSTWLRIVARPRPGVSVAETAARLDAVAQAPEWQPPHKFTGERLPVRLSVSSASTGLSDLRAQFSQSLLLLMGVVAIVLLVTCANVGNLVLARAASRRAEFALRVALGAGRSRLIRQILVEGLVLAAAGGACGALLAYWGTRALLAAASAGRAPIDLDVSPDLRVLTFATIVSGLTGLLFASVPALRASRAAIGGDGRSALASTRTAARGPSTALIVSQVAFSVVLIAGAGLFVRTLQNLHRHQTAVDESRVLLVPVEPRGAGQRSAPGMAVRLDRMYRDLLERVRRMPGVHSASLARTSPLTPIAFSFRVMAPAGGEPHVVPSLMVYPQYFATLGIPVVMGRDFDESDLRPDSPFAVVVNEAFVRRFIADKEPLGTGHRLSAAAIARPGEPWRPGRPVNVVGVVQDTRYPALREAPVPTVYQTFLQSSTGFGQMVLHVKVAPDAAPVARQVAAAVQAVDKDVPMFPVHTLEDEVAAALVRERLVAILSSGFGLTALALIGIGLYGLMAYSISQRTAEIGVRITLGAKRADVGWMIVRQALTVVFAGIAIGFPAAWIVSRVAASPISGILFEITPSDPFVLAASSAVMVLVGLCAAVLPARRASRIDPIAALRS